MWQYLVAMLAVPVLLIGWLLVQKITRKYAESHPEYGPYREEGGGCGKTCGCKNNHCENKIT